MDCVCKRELKRPDPKKMETGFVVMPRATNHYGNVHGGVIVHEADNLAYALASSFSRSNAVTARIGEWNFLKPVREGNYIHLYAEIVRVGRTSMDISICVAGENLQTGDVFEVANAMFTMVSVDENMKPHPIPPENSTGC